MEKAEASSRLLVKATQSSIQGGVRINLDLLTAQQQLFQTQRDLLQARYNYLLSNLRLRAAAGTLVEYDVQTVAGYFSAK
jgi:protease secretion system outer membrane protein